PLVGTDELVDRMARHEAKLTRLCISMVTHPFAWRDTADITERITTRLRTPLSILVAPPTLNRGRIEQMKAIGVDMVGIGLDAVTEDLFRSLRTDVPAGGAGLSWDQYWRVVDDARDAFGPWKVNVHTLVGLGETDADLIDIFCRLADREIFSYLFCFNPEPDSRLADHPKSPLRRWRRIQLAKHLIETEGFRADRFAFDDDGSLAGLDEAPAVEPAVASGIPFMTNGCPGAGGEPGCTRPYGSYRPSEPFRDFPFLPEGPDLTGIRADLDLPTILNKRS
ncbi:MAG: radical SAM protein, partial [Acidimicrobiia bacterium]